MVAKLRHPRTDSDILLVGHTANMSGSDEIYQVQAEEKNK